MATDTHSTQNTSEPEKDWREIAGFPKSMWGENGTIVEDDSDMVVEPPEV